jgi:hypothetical protein
MKKIFIPIFIILSVVLVSCRKNFDEINTNPNNPERVNPELLMVNVVRSTVNQMTDDAFSVGNIVAQYAAEIREPGTDRYAWGSFSVWSNGYSTLRNVQNLYNIATERKLNNYKGIAHVMRALIFSRMTDCYGALPYSEALKGKAEDPVYTPKFDTQEEVYRGLIEELKQANQLLSATGGPVRNDILYNGDFLKWKKLANSLRLRLLLRRSAKVDPSAEMKEILNNAKEFPIMETNADNAVLKYVESPNLFPVTGQRPGFFLDRRLSKTLADKLNEIGDPRLPVFAQPTAESVAAGQLRWVGVRNGEPDANLGSSIDKKVSALGSIYYNGLQVPVPAQGIVLTLAEVKFILAEASHRGWINGNPKSLYEEGIKASMDYYRTVSGANITLSNEYLNQPGVAYTTANGLQMIGIQRWIALYFNDLQGWHEWKRTGFPVLTPSFVNNNNNRIPVRFLYPTDLQVTNRENYLAAVAAQGEDNINTRLWLNK